MVKIKYTGPGSKVIAGKHVMHGETVEVNEKLVSGLRGDPDIEFMDELPLMETAAEAPAEPEVASEPEAPVEPIVSQLPEMPKPIQSRQSRKPRIKKK